MSSNLIQLHNGTKSLGGKLLFEEVTFSINDGEHVGLIGANGSGKTTLFRILVGQESLDQGELIASRALRLGYLAQEDFGDSSKGVMEFISDGALTPEWELKKMALQMGINEVQLSQPLTQLSGGYQMRCKLVKLLGSQPNLLLLDEPTNYLDLETLLLLENFLLDYSGAFILISHDREFLRRVIDHVLEIDERNITKFSGGLDDYFEQKSALREQLSRTALSQEKKRQTIMDFANRFRAKATKARQVQARLKQLDRMEVITTKGIPITARIPIPEPERSCRDLIELSNTDVGYEPGHPILKNVQLLLQRGEHVAIVGVNGAGKSTLIKTLGGHLTPENGTYRLGEQVVLGYYAQHLTETLHSNETVLEAFQRAAHPTVLRQEIVDLAGALLFSGPDVQKRIGILSGGEKARVALGQILLKKCQLLLLDEPTNHLDFETVEALTLALMHFKGTLVVVSHDRSFIRRVANRIYEINNKHVSIYPGTYDEYVWSQQKGLFATSASGGSNPQAFVSAPAVQGKTQINFKEERKRLTSELKSKEKEFSRLEIEIEGLNSEMERLNNQIIESPIQDALECTAQLTLKQKSLEEKEQRWLTLVEEIESLKEKMSSLNSNNSLLDPSES